MSDDRRFLTGLDLFNSADFFECHDVWEDLWIDTVGRDKRFYQGMIQAAVAYYHASNDNHSGAASLLTKSLDKLEEYPAAHHGIDLELLRVGLRADRERLTAHFEGRVTALELHPPRISIIT